MASLADAFAQIESSGDPTRWNTLRSGRRSRYRGLFQFGPDQERRYGITDWTNPDQQRRAFEQHVGTLRTDLSRRLGRTPADWELYFGHQQGPSGSTALLQAAPGTPAWQAIRRYYGSDALAQQAIRGNIPRGHALYGQDPNSIMASDFARMWQDRFGRTSPGPGGVAPTLVSSPGGPAPAPSGETGAPWWQGVTSGLGGLFGIGSAHAQTLPQPGGAPKGTRENPYQPGEAPPNAPEGTYVGFANGSLLQLRGGRYEPVGIQGGPPTAGRMGAGQTPPGGEDASAIARRLFPDGPQSIATEAPPSILGPIDAPLMPQPPSVDLSQVGPPPRGAPFGAPPAPPGGDMFAGLEVPSVLQAPSSIRRQYGPVPPFGEPTVTPAPPNPETGRGFTPGDPSTWAPQGRPITQEISDQLGPPQAPQPDADAIVRGAQQAADERTAQERAQPGFFDRLMQSPAFLAGLSILGTAPGGNWGPNAAQAASQAIRSRREQTEYERLQSRRSTMDRVWREAFGPNGQPNMSHPLMQGMPPEMASTIYAMGPEDGLPQLQRWQFFRGQQAEQLRTQQARQLGIARQFGLAPPEATPESEGEQVRSSLSRLRQGAGLGDSPVGLGAAPTTPPGTMPPIPRPVPGVPGATVAPSSTPTQAPTTQPGSEPVVRIGNMSLPVSQARALAAMYDAAGQRSEVLEQAITAAERQGAAPSGYRWGADGRLEAIPGGPGDRMTGEQAGRLAMMQTARGHLAEARQYFERRWSIGEAGRAMIGGPIIAAEYDRQRRTVRLGVEAALRAMTGAAAPQSEVDDYMSLFMPRVTDSVETARQKLGLLEQFMARTETLITRGQDAAPPGSGPRRTEQTPPGGDGFTIRRIN